MALKLVGAGFGRTGTTSVRDALGMIGYGPCYHMKSVVANPSFAAYWARLGRGEKVDWDEVFEGYVSTIDWPSCTYWRELAEYYPDAKILLTVRDPERWFESTQNTIFSRDHRDSFYTRGADPNRQGMVRVLYEQTFQNRQNDHDFAIAVFNAHNEEVRRSVPKERLLVYDIKEGWEPLCKFLGVPVPNRQFPRTNTSEEWFARGH
jgi:hypothetical protein